MRYWVSFIEYQSNFMIIVSTLFEEANKLCMRHWVSIHIHHYPIESFCWRKLSHLWDIENHSLNIIPYRSHSNQLFSKGHINLFLWLWASFFIFIIVLNLFEEAYKLIYATFSIIHWVSVYRHHYRIDSFQRDKQTHLLDNEYHSLIIIPSSSLSYRFFSKRQLNSFMRYWVSFIEYRSILIIIISAL